MNKSKSKIDYLLLLCLFCIGVISIISLMSAQDLIPPKLADTNFAQKQMIWYIFGGFMILMTMLIDFDRYKYIIRYIYAFGMLLLLGLEFLDKIPFFIEKEIVLTLNNATSWYGIPGIGTFQPAELMKLVLILVLSQIIAKHNEQHLFPTKQDDWLLIGKITAVSLPPLLLIIKQPDLGSAMVIIAIVAAIMIVSGIRFRYIMLIAGSVIAIGAFLVWFYFQFPDIFTKYIPEYQLGRFYGWLLPYEYPEYGYQLQKGLLSIGSGMLLGKGFSENNVYVPEPQTDFIFAVFSENFGFIGASILVALFFILIYRVIITGIESNDPYGSYICAGIVGLLTFQVFQNIGMTIGLLPITGIPLPFVSYGGTSLLIYMICIGLVLNVRSRTKEFMFAEK